MKQLRLDGRQIMVAVISNKHLRGLGKATGLSEKLEMIGPRLDVDLNTKRGRFEARDTLDAVVRPCRTWKSTEVAEEALKAAGVLVGGFQTFEELVNSDPRYSTENPMLTEIDQLGIGRVLAPRVLLKFVATPAADAVPSSPLGSETTAVLKASAYKGVETTHRYYLYHPFLLAKNRYAE